MMDKYHSIHGQDEASFDLTATHRLPTVSAADALEDLDDATSRYVSTGLPDLDEALGSASAACDDHHRPTAASKRAGGIPRGQVAEIWGPPGVGKTALGIQLVANALSDGHAAVWVDCSFSVCGQRLKDVAQAIREARSTGSASEPTTSGLIAEKFTHYSCPTLAHLIALLCRPTATTLPKDTAVVVVSSLSTLVNHAFPKSSEHRPGPQLGKGPSLAARRLQTLQHVVSALQKLAATRNCAAVVLTQCATKMQAESGATLVPAINANVWEQGVSTRLVVFKDWAWKDGSPSTYDASQPSVVLTSTPRRKRKIDDAGLEVPDSDEGEGDYGWEVDDDAAAPVPPQTQGSEDLLLGVNHGLYDEDDGENDDDEAGGDRVVQDSEDDGGLVNDRDSGDGSEAEDELGPGPRQQGGLDGASAGPDSLNSGTDRR
ncbi:DNA repair protein rhp55 like [Verticillium longisporum]|uniref:DNA repair protein rhp55 like n=1 Tax=Verticillium longisporum TaxID=100787 RepID=A0A8I3AJF6_VERLO|nr:DNA repair protein rhp55 like [Verticillium longisporum]